LRNSSSHTVKRIYRLQEKNLEGKQHGIELGYEWGKGLATTEADSVTLQRILKAKPPNCERRNRDITRQSTRLNLATMEFELETQQSLISFIKCVDYYSS